MPPMEPPSRPTVLLGCPVQRERLGSDELSGECRMLSQLLKIKKPRGGESTGASLRVGSDIPT
jgi:hypothetical protein